MRAPRALRCEGRVCLVDNTPPDDNTPPRNPGDSKNCSDFSTYAAAKRWCDTYYPHYGDVADLDRDNDRLPCETLPGGPS